MDLAQFLQKAGSSAPKPVLPFSLVEAGLPQGALVELSGTLGGGKLEALLRFLAENAGLQVAWVEEGRSAYPCAFPQYGVSLERVLFVNAEAPHPEEKSRLLDCAHQILRSQVFGILVLLPRDSFKQKGLPHTWRSAITLSERDAGASRDSRSTESRGCRSSELGEIELRRLQIAAEKSGTTVFIVRETPSVANSWPLTAQLQVERTSPSLGDWRGEIRVKVLKSKFQYRERFTDENAGSQALA